MDFWPRSREEFMSSPNPSLKDELEGYVAAQAIEFLTEIKTELKSMSGEIDAMKEQLQRLLDMIGRAEDIVGKPHSKK
jgi:hypothetical protein